MKSISGELLRCKLLGDSDGIDGYYRIKHHKIQNYYFQVVASNGLGWDHVSVSLLEQHGKRTDFVKRTPTWAEMCFIKDFFFEKDEVVMQLHPKESDYVNVHDYCLHLWKPQQVDVPTPPPIFV